MGEPAGHCARGASAQGHYFDRLIESQQTPHKAGNVPADAAGWSVECAAIDADA
jgi:hypothetical protein